MQIINFNRISNWALLKHECRKFGSGCRFRCLSLKGFLPGLRCISLYNLTSDSSAFVFLLKRSISTATTIGIVKHHPQGLVISSLYNGWRSSTPGVIIDKYSDNGHHEHYKYRWTTANGAGLIFYDDLQRTIWT